jgi:hypothetical protein
MKLSLTLPALLLLVGCGRHRLHGSESAEPLPTYREVEVNDDPLQANHFGVLRPGDRFLIEGFVRDDGLDPFDGFAFTAGGPIHVDFQLFIDDPRDDLDVCLYDPLVDETLACYATADNPERGGVDVSDGGFDFHLVVESFHGSSTYTLEIDVQPLFAARAAGSQGGRAVLGESRVDEGRLPAAGASYRRNLVQASHTLLEHELLVDENGTVLELVYVHPL